MIAVGPTSACASEDDTIESSRIVPAVGHDAAAGETIDAAALVAAVAIVAAAKELWASVAARSTVDWRGYTAMKMGVMVESGDWVENRGCGASWWVLRPRLRDGEE